MASSKNVPKKRKLLEEKRLFNDKWLLDYFVTPNTTLKGPGSICLICKESISVNKEYNVKPHYESRHSEYNTKYPAKSNERQKGVDFLKSHLIRQQTIFMQKVNPTEFWQTVNQYSYPTLKTAANKLLCMVGSIYCCEHHRCKRRFLRFLLF